MMLVGSSRRRNAIVDGSRAFAAAILTSFFQAEAPWFLIKPWHGTRLTLQTLDTLDTSKDFSFAQYPDPVLRIDAKEVKQYDEKLKFCVYKLQKVCQRVGAVGLAATQCGIDAQILVLRDAVYINPHIVYRSDEFQMKTWREQCLVLPQDIRVETLRDASIQVAAFDIYGTPFVATLEDEEARAFQHEFDHMHGILIIDHSYSLLSSSSFPSMLDLEAPLHSERRYRAWDRTSSFRSSQLR
mmetsp:Transcript_699/g.1006  ORF Transcript_699/g.1006 Transcript_699/m.1006 type:complete len:241 (+) Transcript_699:24-746(+)